MSDAWSLYGPEPTRSTILRAAAALATVEGLDRLSVASLAITLGLNKRDLSAQFGSTQELQLATVREAAQIFGQEVVRPALAAPPGLAQLAGVCEAFFAHLERRTFPGGSFMASGTLELNARPGPVRDLIARSQAEFGALIRGFAATALERGELPAWEDPDRLVFELNGIMLAAETNFVQHDDLAVLTLARQIVRQRLDLPGQP